MLQMAGPLSNVLSPSSFCACQPCSILRCFSECTVFQMEKGRSTSQNVCGIANYSGHNCTMSANGRACCPTNPKYQMASYWAAHFTTQPPFTTDLNGGVHHHWNIQGIQFDALTQ